MPRKRTHAASLLSISDFLQFSPLTRLNFPCSLLLTAKNNKTHKKVDSMLVQLLHSLHDSKTLGSRYKNKEGNYLRGIAWKNGGFFLEIQILESRTSNCCTALHQKCCLVSLFIGILSAGRKWEHNIWQHLASFSGEPSVYVILLLPPQTKGDGVDNKYQTNNVPVHVDVGIAFPGSSSLTY